MFKAKKITAAVMAAAMISCTLLGTASLAGCSTSNDEILYFNMSSMSSTAELYLPSANTISGGITEEAFSSLCKDVSSLLITLEKDLSTSQTIPAGTDLDAVTDTYSIYRFNEVEPGGTVQVDFYTYDIFSRAMELYEQTDGYFNPAVYYNVQAYGFGETETKEYPDSTDELPSSDEIAAYTDLASHFGEVTLSADKETGTYTITKPDATVSWNGEIFSMKVDMGGIGKGYATDLVNDLLDEYNVQYGYFLFGNSSIAVKKYYGTDSGQYQLGITNPRYVKGATSGVGSVETYASYSVKDSVVSTSGDSEQYYEIDGTRYCHIINPKTGSPIATGIMSATVVGGTATENDAYTTAIMAMGTEKATEFIQGLTDRRAAFVYESGTGSAAKYYVVSTIDDIQLAKNYFELV